MKKKDIRKKSHLCARIPIELHDAVRKEQIETGLWLTELIEQILVEHYTTKEGKQTMEKQRTLAIQISGDLFERLKKYIDSVPKLSQKAFITDLIIKALDEAEAEAEANN